MLEAFVSLNDVGIKAVASISEEALCARKNSFAFRSDANGDDSGDLGDESRRVPPVSTYKLGPSLGEGSRRSAKALKCMISAAEGLLDGCLRGISVDDHRMTPPNLSLTPISLLAKILTEILAFVSNSHRN